MLVFRSVYPLQDNDLSVVWAVGAPLELLKWVLHDSCVDAMHYSTPQIRGLRQP